MRKSGSGSSRVGMGWKDMILLNVEDPSNWVNPWNLRQSEWDWKLETIECILSVWWDEVEMRCLSTPGSAEYILPVILSTSITLVSLSNHRDSLKMYFKATIERVWRCTWRMRSSELRDALGGEDQANLKMHLETERSSKLRDALRGRDWASLEMQLEA